MDTNQLLLSLSLGLNKQRDGLSLTNYVLRNALPKLVGDAKVSLFEVFVNEKDEESDASLTFKNVDYRDERVDQRLDVEELKTFAFDSNGSFFAGVQELGDKVAIPIKSDLGPLRLLFICPFTKDALIRSAVFQFMELYLNQANLVDQMERDQLTKLLNRKSFDTYYDYILSSTETKAEMDVWLGVLDIDHFKRVNDTYGHLYGDEVLLHFSQLIERNFRYSDIPFRFGGEEFVVLLETDKADFAKSALNRFRVVVEGYDFPGVGQVTVSIGFMKCERNTLPTTLIDQADQALYYAKENGRNQVVYYEDIAESKSSVEEGDIDLF